MIVGSTKGLEAATRRLQQAGAKRVIPLNVSAAFHTPLMRAAAARLRAVLGELRWQDPALPVMANLTGEPYPTAAEIPDTLERQLFSPVRWAACVEALKGLGVDTYIEVGPKRALTGMLRELHPEARAVNVATAEDAATALLQ